MKLTLQYFDGCPNWEETRRHLDSLREEGFDIDLELQRIESQEKAERAGFRGSPTVLIEGTDAFADPDAPVGLACRVYRTEAGFAGSPSREQLRLALSATRPQTQEGTDR